MYSESPRNAQPPLGPPTHPSGSPYRRSTLCAAPPTPASPRPHLAPFPVTRTPKSPESTSALHIICSTHPRSRRTVCALCSRQRALTLCALCSRQRALPVGRHVTCLSPLSGSVPYQWDEIHKIIETRSVSVAVSA